MPYRYPEAVEKAANKIPDAITDEEIAASLAKLPQVNG